MIKEHFSSLTSPSPERPRPAFDVPDHPGTRYAVVTDKETTATAVELSDLRPARNQGSVGGYRDIMLDQLFGAHARRPARRARVRARTRRFSAPPRTAGCSRRRGRETRRCFRRSSSNDGVDARARRARHRAAARRAIRLHRDRARSREAGDDGAAPSASSPKAPTASRRAAPTSTRGISSQSEALPTIWQELAFHRRFVPGITLAEVNALAARLVSRAEPPRRRLRARSGRRRPARPGAARGGRQDGRRRSSSKPYVDAAAGQALMDAPPARGSIVKTTDASGSRHHRVDAVERRDRRAQADDAEGGSDSVPRDGARRHVARERRRLHSGPRRRRRRPGRRRRARSTRVTLDKILAGKARGRHAVHRRDRRGDGRRQHAAGSRNDVPAAVPAIHAAARRSDGVRRDGVAGARRCSRIRWRAPTSCSTRRSTRRSAGNSPRRQPETPATVEQWNLAKSLAFYKARFADASNFTFVFVGSFTPDTIKPLVETYIASLPATHAHETLARPRHHAADRRRREDDREGHRAEERGGDRLLRAVRVRRCAPAGAADDDAACCSRGCSTRSGRSSAAPTASRRRRTPTKFPRPEYTRADRVDVRSGAHRDARAARVRGDRVRQGHAALARSRWR